MSLSFPNRCTSTLAALLTLVLGVQACVPSPAVVGGEGLPELRPPSIPGAATGTPGYQPTVTPAAEPVATEKPLPTPTLDAIRIPPTPRSQPESYVVRAGDNLGAIGWRFGVSPNHIAAANELDDPSYLYPGQVLVIPVPEIQPPGPSFKILPDSELVFGPLAASFDLVSAGENWEGALSAYQELVEEQILDGGAIVQLVAERFSVNPRLLLALLEYQAGWLSHAWLPTEISVYPLGLEDPDRVGMFHQLSWAADRLNRGYYLWRAGWAGPYYFSEGAVVNPGPGINAGTAAVQYFFSLLYTSTEWRQVVGQEGFYQTWTQLFGDPFRRAVEPLVPADLSQPTLRLPIQDGTTWAFTGGPHGAWGSGSGWGGLDFAPPGTSRGCVTSEAWVVASADGQILLIENGRVIQDLSGDGVQGTGWELLYMHIESRDRVASGTFLEAGDPIGHPSCEGGVSNGTHVHLARKYNGEWIPADGALPFNLDGWVSSGWGHEYDGYLQRGDVTLEACVCRMPGNQISR